MDKPVGNFNGNHVRFKLALLLLGFEGLSLVGKVDFEDNLHENH